MVRRTRRELRERKRLRSRRIRALLAGGLVLGVGAAATLAAWNDSEHATATFTAGRFDIVGSVDGQTFSQHPTAPGAGLQFTLPTPAGALTPGDTAYTLFSVKTVAPASMPGTVQIKANAANNSGLGAYLTYRVRTIAQLTCDATSFATGTDVPGLATGVPLTTSATGAQALAADGTAQVNYCFAVTLPAGTPNAAQGATLAASWEFAATSTR
jgi:predicted ribosomally synthesized peptide with SipW-like signal peptide